MAAAEAESGTAWSDAGELRSACGGSKLDSASLSFSNKIESETGDDSFDRLKRFWKNYLNQYRRHDLKGHT